MEIQPDFNLLDLKKLLGEPLTLSPVASGQSNPTWFVTQGSREMVLRKKPAGATLQSAHAVDREYRIMKALEPTDVPVPEMIMLENDPDVLGTPFYLMERLKGQVFEDSAMANAPDPTFRLEAYKSAAQVLASLHRVDFEAVGLSDYGKTESYYLRQVKRWTRQWDATRTRDDDTIDSLSAWFADNIPAEEKATIVHGDYRIGNLMFERDKPEVIGVLDWELSTLGNPLADLAHFALFWELAPAQLGGLSDLELSPLGIPEFPAFMDMYRQAGGVESPLQPFHRAFALYRMAIIFEGIASREMAGQAVNSEARKVGALAVVCARLADEILSSDSR